MFYDKPQELISAGKIKKKVAELAAKISVDYKDKKTTFIIVANGALIFATDLIKELDTPVKFDILSVSSYDCRGNEKETQMQMGLKLDMLVPDHDVIIIDDILDTGKTLAKALEVIKGYNPRSIKLCVLLDKPIRRAVDIKCDYVGFKIPDEFVVGYGLDYNELYRDLPYIGVLRER